MLSIHLSLNKTLTFSLCEGSLILALFNTTLGWIWCNCLGLILYWQILCVGQRGISSLSIYGVQGLTHHLWLAMKTCGSMLLERKVGMNAFVVSAIVGRRMCYVTLRANIFPNTLSGTATFVESKLKRRALSRVINICSILSRLNMIV